MPGIINLPARKFDPLENLPAVRGHSCTNVQARHLKGTILPGPEGSALFGAGVNAVWHEIEAGPV